MSTEEFNKKMEVEASHARKLVVCGNCGRTLYMPGDGCLGCAWVDESEQAKLNTDYMKEVGKAIIVSVRPALPDPIGSPSLQTCIADLLAEIFAKADEALPKEFDRILIAAERVEAALAYDNPWKRTDLIVGESYSHPDFDNDGPVELVQVIDGETARIADVWDDQHIVKISDLKKF